jgi:acetyl esterase/lipase
MIDFIMSSSLPAPPPLADAGSITVELGCGVLMVAGYQARVVAGVLALFCLATAMFFHTNFADPDPKHPLASPLCAQLFGLPPVRIHVGDDEVLLDDSRRYVERAVGSGASGRRTD